jgi:thiamine biosynthesis lipoprotein
MRCSAIATARALALVLALALAPACEPAGGAAPGGMVGPVPGRAAGASASGAARPATGAAAGTAAGAAAESDTGGGPMGAAGGPLPSTVREVPGQPGLFTVRRRTFLMTTHWEVAIATRDPAAAEAPITECFAEIARLESVLSEWKPDTEISHVNAAAGVAPVKVSPELIETLQVALDVGAMTEGGFDITFLPIGRLWKLKDPAPKLPDPAELAKAIALVDYRKVKLDRAAGTAFIEKRGMAIGLGGIGQGIAVDRCSAILHRRGFDDFIVDGSGDLYVSGRKGTQGWMVGVAHPRIHGYQFARLSLTNRAITTAGDYERYAIIDGKHYHHIIDPKTGYPVEHTVSVTALASTTVLADALDTGLFVMGADRGLPLIEARADLDALFVSADGTVRMTSRLVPIVKLDSTTLDLSTWR